MNLRRGLVVLSLACGALAGILYQVGAQRLPVVVAATDLEPGAPITGRDVELAALPPDALPAGALTSADAAVGRFARVSLGKGQVLLAGAIADAPAAFASGVTIPAGSHAVAVPVDAAHALGGAITPGARVDVIAVPTDRGAQDSADQPATELVVASALVLDVRGEQGAPIGPLRTPPDGRSLAPRDRVGSVVVAVSAEAELWIADRIPTSTFVLALVPPTR